jgi:hypothetical protein
MPALSEVIDKALVEVDGLRKVLKQKPNRQVRSNDERALAKATALAWFNRHRLDLAALESTGAFAQVDDQYRALLSASDRSTDRAKYDRGLKELRQSLAALRTEGVTKPASRVTTGDDPPSFAPLVTDEEMQEILGARWKECVACLSVQAPLAATVMMGGLIEGLLLARINREVDHSPIFKARTAPQDKQGKTKPLSEWTLKNYIDVVHELTWISESAKDVGEVLRDYRNYIHPSKQARHGRHLTISDAQMFWEVSKAVTREVIKSARN